MAGWIDEKRIAICRQMPPFAVPQGRVTIGPLISRHSLGPGERNRGTIPSRTASWQSVRRTPGLLEGNRGIPEPRRHHRPTLGVYASLLNGGRVRRGDFVRLE